MLPRQGTEHASRRLSDALLAHGRRYLSHFRSVHRGAYFAELRTTTVRKLLPESWGFLCPVHTPDGSPCGLLNHFTAACRIVAQPSDSPPDTRQAVIEVPPPPPPLRRVGCLESAARMHEHDCHTSRLLDPACASSKYPAMQYKSIRRKEPS